MSKTISTVVELGDIRRNFHSDDLKWKEVAADAGETSLSGQHSTIRPHGARLTSCFGVSQVTRHGPSANRASLKPPSRLLSHVLQSIEHEAFVLLSELPEEIPA